MEEEQEKGKALGITGIIIGLIVPFVGLILGIIGAAKSDSHTGLGITAIVVSILAWMFWALIFALSMTLAAAG